MKKHNVTKVTPSQGDKKVIATLPSKKAAWKWAETYALDYYEPCLIEKHPVKGWIGLNELDQGPGHSGLTTVAILEIEQADKD